MDKQKNLITYTLLFIVAIFYLWDIGNMSGIRQGTESLYLQISKEMYEANSYMTPLYKGEHHWSKPPLHFWLPFPLYFAGGGYSLTLARAAVALFGLLAIFFISLKLFRWRQVPILLTFVLLAGSHGLLKFSRTFMMEIPLTLLPAISLFYFWEYLEKRREINAPLFKNSSLWLAIIFMALSVLIKGPVTLVMAFIGLGFFQVLLYLKERRFIVAESFWFFLLSTLFSSIWFLLCYLRYGSEFFDYFFLRENLGKFGQKKMPSKKIVEGLLLYTLPWLFVIPLFLGKLKNSFEKFDRLALYFFTLFCGFFFIWFIPAQKSHHYALPAIPFALGYILLQLDTKTLEGRFVRYTQYIMVAILAIIPLLSLYFSKTTWEVFINLLILFLIVAIIYLLKKKETQSALVATGFAFMAIWTFVLPIYFLPVIPATVLDKIENDSGFTYYLVDRRSYFYSETLGQNIDVIDVSQTASKLAQDKVRIFVYRSRLGNIHPQDYHIVAQWRKWLRKVKWKDAKRAILHKDLEQIKEDVFLLEKK